MPRSIVQPTATTLFETIILAFCLLCTACEHEHSHGAPVPSPTTGPPELASHQPAPCQATQALADLDPRTPVPLEPMMAWHQKQNMMQHLVVIQRIVAGLAREDWSEIEGAAGQIGTSPQMRQMCQHMGAGAEGFAELALDFHHRADAISTQAQAHDSSGVLQATSNTLQACTTCHAAYRQDVVTSAQRQARMGGTSAPARVGRP